MGEAKRKRAKLNAKRKKYKPTRVEEHHEHRHTLLSYLCNQFAYGHIGPKNDGRS